MPSLTRSYKPAHQRTERERQREVNRRRDPDKAKIYNTAAWRRVRRSVLLDQPICSTPGCNKPASHVDHLDGDPTNWSRENLDGKCPGCHSRKTVRQDGGFGRAPTA